MATAANGCQVTPLPFILLISLLVSGRGRNANPSCARTPSLAPIPSATFPLATLSLSFFCSPASHSLTPARGRSVVLASVES